MPNAENKLFIGTAPDSGACGLPVTRNRHCGRILRDEPGLKRQSHSHADSHVCAQTDIETFVENAGPSLVNICLDTGHTEYGSVSSLEFIHNYPGRIGYLHLKQNDPDVLVAVQERDLIWAAANSAGVMVEPPKGLPDLRAVIGAVEALTRPIFGTVEHDMYPVADFSVRIPIAQRTAKHLSSCGARTRVR